jgi:WD40 repeat protein
MKYAIVESQELITKPADEPTVELPSQPSLSVPPSVEPPVAAPAVAVPPGDDLDWADPGLLLAFSPDGAKLVTTASGTAGLWLVATSQRLGMPIDSGSRILDVAFGPDATKVATAGSDGTARLWDATTGKRLGSPMKHPGQVADGPSFAPRYKSEIAGSPDGVKATTGPDATTTRAVISAPVHSVAFSPDGTMVATGGDDKMVRLWDATTGEALGAPMEHASGVLAVAFSPDGTRLATAGWGTRLWDATTGQPRSKPAERGGWPDVLARSRDGAKVVVASDATTLRLLDAISGNRFGQSMGLDGEVAVVTFSPDGKSLATATVNGTVRLWDATTGKALGPPMNCAVDFQGRRIAPESEDGRPQGAVTSMDFSPDGRKLATAIVYGSVLVWGTTTWKPLGVPMGHVPCQVDDVAFSPDGKQVATAGVDRRAQLWDAATGKPLGPPLMHDGIVTCVAFSRDGKLLATASDDEMARIWDLETRWPVGAPMKHTGAVRGVTFSPDGAKLATVSDGQVWLWDVRTTQPLGQPIECYHAACAAAFSPDSAKVVVALGNKKIARAWLAPQSLPDDSRCVTAYVDLVSCWKEDSVGTLHGTTMSQREDARQELAKSPAWLAQQRRQAARRAHAWHEIEAHDYEAAGHLFAAAFHLRCLCREEPNNSDFRNRLRRAEAELNRERGQREKPQTNRASPSVPKPKVPAPPPVPHQIS